MNKNQQKYTAFMESVCKQFNCPEMLPALNAGFKAFCEATDDIPQPNQPLDRKTLMDKYAGYTDLNQFLDALRHDFHVAPTTTLDSKENVLYIEVPGVEFIVTCLHNPYDRSYDIDFLDIVTKADTPDVSPTFESIGIYNAMRLTTDEMLLLQEMRQYYKDLCRDGWMSDFLHGGGNPLSAADNLALLDALVEMYGSVEDLPEGFLALYHKLGGKKI